MLDQNLNTFGTMQGPDGLEYAIAEITPAVAVAMLATNEGNRRISNHTLNRYQSDMLSGLWQNVGDPIRFDPAGKLIDGQHRLTAIANTGVSQHMLIIGCIPRAAQIAMDQGKTRTSGDQLDMLQIPYANNVSAAVRGYLAYHRGLLVSHGMSSSNAVTTSAIVAWANEPAHRALIDEVMEYRKDIAASSVRTSAGLSAAMVLHEISADQAREFFRLLSRGGAPEKSPINVIDRKFARWSRKTTMGHAAARVHANIYFALTIEAWNRWIRGMECSQINIPSGGYTAANFPVAIHPRQLQSVA